jgi:hypothetical protein
VAARGQHRTNDDDLVAISLILHRAAALAGTTGRIFSIEFQVKPLWMEAQTPE